MGNEYPRQRRPYALVGGVNDRTAKATKGVHIAALKDINLEVKQGEEPGSALRVRLSLARVSAEGIIDRLLLKQIKLINFSSNQ